MELKQVDLLRGQHALVHNQLLIGARETVEARRIRAKTEVGAYWTDGGAIANSETDRLHRVIEVLNVALAEAETDMVDILIDVAHIVEQHASQVVADQWESDLGGMK